MFLNKKFGVAILACAAGSLSALAQAPAESQVWDVRFAADETGPFAQGPLATQIGITIFARVGILPNTSASGTANLGVSRVGGAGSSTTGFRVFFSDGASRVDGVSEGTVTQGRTSDIDGRDLNDAAGVPLAGHFAPFRGGFPPQVGPLYVGRNSASFNGQVSSPDTGTPVLFNLVGGRTLNYGSDGSGALGVAAAIDTDPAHLAGELTPVYRMYFFPTAGTHGRIVTGSVRGLSARYLYRLASDGSGVNAPSVDLANIEFAFQVPAPGAASLLGLGAGLLVRRRRAWAGT